MHVLVCMCERELVNCFTGCAECGVMLARILDSVPEHYTLRKAPLQLQIQLTSLKSHWQLRACDRLEKVE